jgi:hypothetical protein
MLKRCAKCKGLFESKHPRHIYCEKHQKTGMRGMRHYHAMKGDCINAGIGASQLRQFSNHIFKEVCDETQ